jgi:hypothetical protein
MKTKSYTVYTFDELSEEGKQKAIERYADINLDHEWWDSIYEDAANIGLKITAFDIDHGRYAKGGFTQSPKDVMQAILENHGETCETYRTAKKYQEEIQGIDQKYDKSEEFDNYEEYDEIGEKFLKSLLEDYRMMLQREYEYLTEETQIIDTLKGNEYDFTGNGKID